jgi:hypothetical protein
MANNELNKDSNGRLMCGFPHCNCGVVCMAAPEIESIKPKLAAVPKPIYESNFRDIAKTLRKIADQIEEAGDVDQLALVTHGSTVEVYALGNGGACDCHMLLACGQRKLENGVLFPGD